LLALAVGQAAAQEPRPQWRWELKREMTSRGTPEETTKTSLRFERFFSGAVRLLRLDLPFPDEHTDFDGSPFDPRLGDIKVRAGFQPASRGELSFPSFVEVTLPTADPESLGSGKLQIGAALRMLAPARLPFPDPAVHRSQFEGQLQQVVSVAGDEERKDVNVTKIELTLNDLWRRRYTFKLKLKPNIDWVQDGDSGAVGEIEGGLLFAEGWRAWLMLGHRVWGPAGIQGTYTDRVEIGLARTY
jgi:hypothetical protein